MAVAAVLGLITIGSKSFWLDEAFSVAIARIPTLELISLLWRFELHAAPYYLLLQPWLALGTGEGITRSLAVVFGVVAVAATFAVGKRYGVAFRAALLFAVFPMFIQYEQETRVYTLATAWSAIATLAYLRLNESPTRLRGLTYIVCGVGAIYIHPFLALVIAAHAVHTVLVKPSNVSRRTMFVLDIAIAVGWIPMLRFMLLHRDKINWIPALTPSLLTEYLVVLGGGLVIAVAAAILLAVKMRRDLLAVWLVVPIVGAILVSVLFQSVIQPRYLLILLPPAAIVIARNRDIVLAGFIALCLVGVGSWYLYGAKDDWRAASAWVSAQALPSDGMIFAPHFVRLPFEYYAEVGEPLYPSVPWTDRYLPGMGLGIAIDPAADNPRIWVVEEHGNQLPSEVAAVMSHYTTIESRTFGTDGPLIRLMQRVP